MTEFTFQLTNVQDPVGGNPTGTVNGIYRRGEKDIPSAEYSQEAELTTRLPELVGEYALRFVRDYDRFLANQEQEPFNCMTFATEAVFGSLPLDSRRKIFVSLDPRYGHGQMRDVSLDEQHTLQAGAMYGIASNLDILQRPLVHAFVGLDELDRHFGVTHRGGKLVVASTTQVFKTHEYCFGPVRLVRFAEPPR